MSMMWIFYSLSSAIFFAIKDVISKKFIKQNVSPNQIIFEEYFLLLILVLILFFPAVDFNSISFLWGFYLLKAIFVGGANLLYLNLLKTHDISTVSPLINLSPLFLLVFSTLFLAETISFIQLIGILIIMISTYFLEITYHHHKKAQPHKFHISDLRTKNSLFFFNAVLLLILFSGAAITDKLILKYVNVYTNLYFTAFVIFIIYLFYYIYEKSLISSFKHIIKEPETLIIAVFSIISNFLILLAMIVPGALISLIIPLRRTSTVFSSLFGGMLFHEKHLKRKIIATSFMLLGVFLIVIGANLGVHIT